MHLELIIIIIHNDNYNYQPKNKVEGLLKPCRKLVNLTLLKLLTDQHRRVMMNNDDVNECSLAENEREREPKQINLQNEIRSQWAQTAIIGRNF